MRICVMFLQFYIDEFKCNVSAIQIHSNVFVGNKTCLNLLKMRLSLVLQLYQKAPFSLIDIGIASVQRSGVFFFNNFACFFNSIKLNC